MADPKQISANKAREIASPIAPVDQALLRGVPVSLEARLGDAELTIETLMALKAGSVVTLDTGLADHVDLYLNGALIARGEIVAVGDRYGVRIAEIEGKP